MAIGGYITDQAEGKLVKSAEDDRDYYGGDQNFVTVIPIDYPRQSITHNNTLNSIASQEDSRNYPLNEKDTLEDMASVPTQSSQHVMNRTVAMASASAEKPPHHQIPSGQCKLYPFIN